MENLWPDFDEMPKVLTPGTILKEQAQALGGKFQNKITGNIVRHRGGESFEYTFRLECPPLGYAYRLFKATYELTSLYPVTVIVAGDIAEELCNTKEESVIEAANEEEFKVVLSRIFSSKKTKHLIQALRLHLE